MANKSQKQDLELVKDSLNSSDAYTNLVKKYEKPIIGYIIRISGVNFEEAEDITQEIFLKAYTNLNNFDQTKKFSSWLFSIAHNETISHWRKNKRKLDVINIENDELDILLTENFDIGKKIDNNLLKDEIKKGLAKLDIKYREVLELKYLNEYSYEEISDIIKKPVNTVGTLLNRAKKKLKNELKDIKYD